MKRKKCGTIAVCQLIAIVFSLFGGISPVAKAAEYDVRGPVVDTEKGMTTYDCIWFGSYWQNDTNGDGIADKNDEKEPIKWRVLSVDGEDAFLLADQGLDCQPYHNGQEQTTWETCSLRTWLNQDFYEDAFSEEEKSAVMETTVSNNEHLLWGRVAGGNDTKDKIYLLSLSEVYSPSYGFPADEGVSVAREADSTKYAIDTISDQEEQGENGSWWLRSGGGEAFSAQGRCGIAANVNQDGSVYHTYHITDGVTIRPVLHLDLSYMKWEKADTISVSVLGREEEFCTALPQTDEIGTWDSIYFGNYFQSNSLTKEPIKWRVLSVDGEDAFLISDQCLDCQSYTEYASQTPWQDCSLRAWLNEDFYDAAFTEEEKSAIIETTVLNEDSIYGMEGGENTQDKIYILSIEEAENSSYGLSDDPESRKGTKTPYAKRKGRDIAADNALSNCKWWLRSPGYTFTYSAYVNENGTIVTSGAANSSSKAIRPVLHLDLSSSVWSKVDAGESPEETSKAVITSAPVSTATPKPSSAAVVSVSKKLQKTAGIKAVCTAGNKIRLTWKRSSGVKQYAIYRSNKKNGKYCRIKTLAGTKKSYTDISVGKGKTYYYKIVPVDRNGTMGSLADATGVRAATHALAAPVIRVTRRQTTGGQKYVQLRLKKYEGTYAEIYVQDKGKYRRIRIRKRTISAYRRRYRLRFQKGGRTVSFRVRTYRIQKGKKQYSGYSRVKALRL